MTEEKVVLYTGRNCFGDAFTFGKGEYISEGTNKLDIIGVIDGKEYSFPFDYVSKNFAKGKINALKLYPYMKLTVYENANKTGRWLVFENADDKEMRIDDLSRAMYNFENKIDFISVEVIKDKPPKKYQSTYIVNSSERFTISELSLHNKLTVSQMYNLELIIIIVLACVAVGCFAVPFISNFVKRHKEDYNVTEKVVENVDA